MTLATSVGYLRYPPPTVYLTDAHSTERSGLADGVPLTSLPFVIWPSFGRDHGRISMQRTDTDVGSSSIQQRVDPSASVRLLTYSTPSGQYELLLSPVEPNDSSPAPEETGTNPFSSEMEAELSESANHTLEPMEVQPEARANPVFPFNDPTYWELPFLQGWLMGQNQAGQRNMRALNSAAPENSSSHIETGTTPIFPTIIPASVGQSRVVGRSGSRNRASRSRAISVTGSSEGASFNNNMHEEGDPQPVVNRIQTELATSLAAAAAAELPCTVKLRIWPHDVRHPCVPLDAERCRLTIPHAVLCRYVTFVNFLTYSCLAQLMMSMLVLYIGLQTHRLKFFTLSQLGLCFS